MTKLRFLKSFMVSTAIFSSFVAGINYIVDTRGIYHTNEARIVSYVKRLTGSPDGLIYVNWERPIKWELARTSDADCFVTGSSRALTINLAHINALGGPCRSLANVAVGGGTIEDFITVAGILIAKPVPAKTLYVGIDPWMFRFGVNSQFSQFEAAYHSARARFGLNEPQWSGEFDKIRNLINAQYLRLNVEAILHGRPDFVIKEVENGGSNIADSDHIFMPDGSLIQSREESAKYPPPESRIGNGSASINPPYVDSSVSAEFASVLEQIHARGTDIVLLIPPYHPNVMRCLSAKTCAALTAVENHLLALARDRGYAVIGGFDPRPFGLGHDFFQDDIHLLPSGFFRLMPHPSTAIGQAH